MIRAIGAPGLAPRSRAARPAALRTRRLVASAAVAFCLATGAAAAPDSRAMACLQPGAAATAQICEAVASELSHDIAAVRALGHELEIRGRHAEALRVYRVAISVHPANRDLLRRSIRARANKRAWQLLAEPAGADAAVTPASEMLADQVQACFSARFATALEPCRRAVTALPEDGALAERLGDVLRSVGRVDEAVQAYNASLNAGQAAARRKRDALKRLVNTIGRQPPPLLPLAPVPVSQGAPPVASAPPVPAVALPGSEPALQPPDATQGEALAPPDVLTLGVRRALLIGNQTYREFPRLETPQADIDAIARLLGKHYGFSDVVRLTNATRYEMLSALSALRLRSSVDDQVLIYYAGHGYLDPVTSRGYWLPVDAQPQNLANWLSSGDITDTLAGLAARHAMVIADSCFSGSLLRAPGVVGLQDRAGLLNRLASRRSRTIMTSGGLEPVIDDGGGQHSVFAAALLRGLNENTGVLEAGRLFVHVRDRVSLHAEQTPQYAPIRSAGHDGGDFLFMRTR